MRNQHMFPKSRLRLPPVKYNELERLECMRILDIISSRINEELRVWIGHFYIADDVVSFGDNVNGISSISGMSIQSVENTRYPLVGKYSNESLNFSHLNASLQEIVQSCNSFARDRTEPISQISFLIHFRLLTFITKKNLKYILS